MTPQEKSFFQAFGERLTELRKAKGLTQVQLACTLGISQQQVHAFEKGTRRIPVSMLPELAHLFGITVDELVGIKGQPRKPGPTSKLQRQLQLLQDLPRSKQRFVSQMLDTVLQQTGS
jgi:transcriptional regulator with XRE-family HTH domain